MREYAKVSPRFWIGETGREIRACGMDAQLVALYLLTSPHSNMIGLYWAPLQYIAHETGLPIERARKALARLSIASFCEYDEATEVVWVLEMARFQIADRLGEKDKQTKGVQNAYDEVPSNPFLAPFFERYAEAFCMTKARGYEAPSKPLRSKEQEQEQEKEQEQAQEQERDESEKDDSPVVVQIPLIGKKTFSVSQKLVDYWSSLYPAVNVPQELRKMAGWCEANPGRRKTSSGIKRFITAWLGKEQDKGGHSPPNGVARIPVFAKRAAIEAHNEQVINDLMRKEGIEP